MSESVSKIVSQRVTESVINKRMNEKVIAQVSERMTEYYNAKDYL